MDIYVKIRPPNKAIPSPVPQSMTSPGNLKIHNPGQYLKNQLVTRRFFSPTSRPKSAIPKPTKAPMEFLNRTPKAKKSQNSNKFQFSAQKQNSQQFLDK